MNWLEHTLWLVPDCGSHCVGWIYNFHRWLRFGLLGLCCLWFAVSKFSLESVGYNC